MRRANYIGLSDASKSGRGTDNYQFGNAMTDRESLTVLFCEDEPIIMMTSVDMLQDAGMTVIEAGSGEEALKQLAASRIDVMVTDMGLPGISGLELVIETRKRLPELPVIFSTGATTIAGAEALTNITILAKPYTEEELIGAIRKATA